MTIAVLDWHLPPLPLLCVLTTVVCDVSLCSETEKLLSHIGAMSGVMPLKWVGMSKDNLLGKKISPAGAPVITNAEVIGTLAQCVKWILLFCCFQ